MKRFALPTFCAAFTLAALLVSNTYRLQSPAAVLSHSPKTPYFMRVVDSHLQPSASRKTLVFAEDSFGKTLNGGVGCSIARNGEHSCWAGSGIWDSGRSLPRQSAAQLDAIRAVLDDMPPTTARPAPENLLIVGCWHDGEWTMQIYDESCLP